MSSSEESEERVCRYCFEGSEDGELISPCDCKGGQKYVHLSCLRRWQRMVIVSQPTHPSLQTTDIRHENCKVCMKSFTCAPPTRHELMASFTGPELAALIDEGCVIAANEKFSAFLEGELERLPDFLREQSSYDHWIYGVYLIHAVKEDKDEDVVIPLTPERLENLRERLGDTLSFPARGRRLRLAPGGSLEGIDDRVDALREHFQNINDYGEIVLRWDPPAGCGEDHVAAVNVTRPCAPIRPGLIESAKAAVARKYPNALAKVKIMNFNGGPCGSRNVSCCIVPGGGGSGRGWTIVEKVEEGLKLAIGRAARRHDSQGNLGGGQAVKLSGLRSAAELNGQVGILLKFTPDTGRWNVRLRDGRGIAARPANIIPSPGWEDYGGVVMVCWGDAQWSRSQLLGEIAKGDWGLCRATVDEIAAAPQDRWRGLTGRLAFAPETEMTEDYLRDAAGEMVAMRAAARAMGPETESEDDDDDQDSSGPDSDGEGSQDGEQNE